MTRYNRDTERDTGDGDAASREPGEARTPGHPESDAEENAARLRHGASVNREVSPGAVSGR